MISVNVELTQKTRDIEEKLSLPLDQRLRRWANVKPTFFQCLVLAENVQVDGKTTCGPHLMLTEKPRRVVDALSDQAHSARRLMCYN